MVIVLIELVSVENTSKRLLYLVIERCDQNDQKVIVQFFAVVSIMEPMTLSGSSVYTLELIRLENRYLSELKPFRGSCNTGIYIEIPGCTLCSFYRIVPCYLLDSMVYIKGFSH